MQGLLKEGVAPSRIILVQPHPSQAFNNLGVEEKVAGALEGVGLNVHVGYTLEGWTEEEEMLSLHFSAPTEGEEPLFVDCKVLRGDAKIYY